MSYSTLFLGINITQFYRKEAIVKHETRYNEITGEPYLKESITGYEYYIAEHKLTTELEDFGKPYNLDVLKEYYEDKIYLGITLAHNDFEILESIEINLNEYNKAVELLKEKLTILGWQNEEIKLIMNCYNS